MRISGRRISQEGNQGNEGWEFFSPVGGADITGNGITGNAYRPKNGNDDENPPSLGRGGQSEGDLAAPPLYPF